MAFSRSIACVRRVQLVSRIRAPSIRLAHSSYGNEQSGEAQGVNEKNPKRHLEHPGPEPPQSKGGPENTESSQGGKPKIQEPYSPQEEKDPDVKAHNDEMRQRHDRSVNQLGVEDMKVDKNFWKGDVGDMSSDKSDDSKTK